MGLARRPLGKMTRVFLAVLVAAFGPGERLWSQQDSVRVVVRIRGIEGALERNARATMALAREAEEGKLPAQSIPHLYRRGESEIMTALRPFGYYEPRVAKALEPGSDHWTAHYVVDPGPVVRVRHVEINLHGPGADEPVFRRSVTEFPLQAGDTMRDPLYEAGKLRFFAAASDSGYLDADFDTATVRVFVGEDAADILMRFGTGPRYKFGPVHFEQSILKDRLLRTRLTFREGQYFRQDKLLELQRFLSEDPYWAHVEVIPQREQAESLEVPIRVILDPRPRWTYEFGGGYGTDTGPRGRANGMWRWLNRRGHYADAELLASFTEQRLTGRYSIPAVLHPTGTLSFTAGYIRTSLNPQSQVSPIGLASRTYTAGARLFRSRLGFRETLSLSYQQASFEIGIDSARTTLLIAGGSWERTRSDGNILPRRGLRTRFEIQGSNQALLSSASFLQLRASAKAIYGFAPRFRLLTRAEIGRTFTSEFHELPPLIRFFTGGDETVRGYRYLSLAPLDSLGDVLGGPALLTGSAEIDYQVMDRWLIAGFTDAGNALERLSLRGLRQSVGGGIRYVSPIGLIRFDVAVAMSPFPETGRIRFHITMGPDL